MSNAAVSERQVEIGKIISDLTLATLTRPSYPQVVIETLAQRLLEHLDWETVCGIVAGLIAASRSYHHEW